MHPRDICQIAGVTHACQLRLLLIRRQPRKVICLLVIETLQIALRLLSNRSISEEALQQFGIHSSDALAVVSSARTRIDRQLVRAKGFLVKKNLRMKSQRSIKILVRVLRIRRYIDAEFFNYALRHGAIWRGTLNRERPSESQTERVADAELVALGVSSKVIVVIENENARLFPCSLAVKVRRSQPADATANDDEVVDLAAVLGLHAGV